MPEHISRKELKKDKIHDAIEHSAEAVYSHKQTTLIVVLIALIAALAYGGGTLYNDRQTAAASVELDKAMKSYTGRIGGTPDSGEPTDITYKDEAARSTDAERKFRAVADKYPRTTPGKLARYYAALCLEDLERHNQALEDLKKLSSGSDKELASLAQFQTAVVYSRTGKVDDAIRIYRALADKPSAFVPRPTTLLELAGILREKNPKEAASLYEQIKKEFPGSAISEEAERKLDTLSPKS